MEKQSFFRLWSAEELTQKSDSELAAIADFYGIEESENRQETEKNIIYKSYLAQSRIKRTK